MIKARGTHRDGQPVVILGLTDQNLERMRAGQPIAFHGGADLGLECHVMIMWGPSEPAIARELGIYGVKVPQSGETQRFDPVTGRIRTDKQS